MPPPEPATSSALQSVVDNIHSEQTRLANENKPLWQGRKTRIDGTKKNTDHLSWNNKNIPLAGMKENILVNVYSGPQGDGYTIEIEKPVEGGVYTKIINTGPETRREQDWTYTPTENGTTL